LRARALSCLAPLTKSELAAGLGYKPAAANAAPKETKYFS